MPKFIVEKKSFIADSNNSQLKAIEDRSIVIACCIIGGIVRVENDKRHRKRVCETVCALFV